MWKCQEARRKYYTQQIERCTLALSICELIDMLPIMLEPRSRRVLRKQIKEKLQEWDDLRGDTLTVLDITKIYKLHVSGTHVYNMLNFRNNVR